jgi:hypothetical protein
MRSMVFGAAAVLAVAAAGVVLLPVRAQQGAPATAPNNTPLWFGMDAEQASQALGTRLVYVRGRPGDEMYLALPNAKGSALSDRQDGLYLQFRRGRLEGWKGDWGSNRP